jgi:cellulose synthase/poly-beta-1,6-N-acetylglucosamine synthase-like glycosyltransferase
MYLLAIIFSLALTIFLVAFIIRLLIFFFIVRNISKSCTSHIHKRQVHVTTSNGCFRNGAIAFLNRSDRDRVIQVKSVSQLETRRRAASDTRFNNKTHYEPFVSVLIASYNEQQLIGRLMKSCAALTYNQDKFEIIVIDDSDDETFHILKNWEKKIPNLKVIHRSNRKGWKGGALNVALNNMSPESSYALIVDADNILPSHILESFVSHFNECSLKENIVEGIQGYPIPTICYNDSDNNSKTDTFDQIREYSNWVSKAIDFRLAKRNLIEFVAKDKLCFPIQITGSLFMIRSEVIKLIGFSEDLTEDWDLTLDLYLSPDSNLSHIHSPIHENRQINSNVGMRKILYDPALISYSSTITKFRAYFKQRMRISEGHTRGFRKNITNILKSNIRVRDKIELLFIGLQYSKFIAVMSLIIIDFFLILTNGADFTKSNNFMMISLSVQATLLSMAIGVGFMGLDVCTTIRSYNVRDVLYLLFLTLCTIPAFVMGSLYGFFRDEGIFYRTERNVYWS